MNTFDTALNRVPVKVRIEFLSVILAAIAFIGGCAAGLLMRAPTVTRTVHVVSAPATAAAVAAGWGTPDQTVDGGQINKQLTGLTCAIWQAKTAILCYRP